MGFAEREARVALVVEGELGEARGARVTALAIVDAAGTELIRVSVVPVK